MFLKPKLNKISSAFEEAHTNRPFAHVLCASTLMAMLAFPAISQETGAETQAADAELEVIQVKGIRKTIQDSVAIKRLSTNIVDGLSAEDIGDLPALSIGEALETLTGASSHRDQGGATSISIRGLGPFLGSTVINGREATNGSGDRSVNFSQFPSELFNKIAIHKTQSASLIEGGVSGQIALETIKPLDHGKRSVQIQAKGNFNPAEADISGSERDFGSRLTFSYIDQFETDKLGDIGVSLGVQKDLKSNPEQEARSSSIFRACRIDPTSSIGIFSDAGQDCATSNGNGQGGGIDSSIDPETGLAVDDGIPFVFVPGSYSYRQNITDDDRESIFAAVQWRPSETLEINVDAEYSDRTFEELRNDLSFAQGRRLDSPVADREGQFDVDLVVSDLGSLISGTSTQRIQTESAFLERLEEYKGGGIEFIYDVNDVLTISADLSYSDTERRENTYNTRLRSDLIEVATVIGQDGSLIPIQSVRNFDVTNPDNFAAQARTRVDLNQFRNNTITAFRTDFEYLADHDVFSKISGGLRYSELEFDSNPRARQEETLEDAESAAASLSCRNDGFPESGFLSSVTGGQALITNFDDNDNVIAAGTGNAYATFDALCLATAVLGGAPVIPEPQDSTQNVDVTEDTVAAYLQADFDTEISGYGLRGNFGVRYVETEVTSTGLRAELQTIAGEPNDEGIITSLTVAPIPGTFNEIVAGGSYTEFLPSANAALDLSDDVLLRGAVYRALSRPDPKALGFGRDFTSSTADGEGTSVTLEDIIGSASANGNPDLDPFTSWNADLAIEWYPNEDTVLAFGTYYKSFEGGFENSSNVETFSVDGEDFDTIVTVQETTDETSTIYGIEVTATHAFSYLPDLWGNFGIKLSYNYADSNFEFEDSNFGASTIVNPDGSTTERAGILAPGNVFGFSDTVASAQLYYQDGGFSAQLNYKFRSEYFQQFTNDPGALRFIDDVGVYEARASYKLNKHLKFSIEAINLFDEPRTSTNPAGENFHEANVYGPRIFAGVVYKL